MTGINIPMSVPLFKAMAHVKPLLTTSSNLPNTRQIMRYFLEPCFFLNYFSNIVKYNLSYFDF